MSPADWMITGLFLSLVSSVSVVAVWLITGRVVVEVLVTGYCFKGYAFAVAAITYNMRRVSDRSQEVYRSIRWIVLKYALLAPLIYWLVVLVL